MPRVGSLTRSGSSRALVLVASVVLTACAPSATPSRAAEGDISRAASAPPRSSKHTWTSKLELDHPLVGRIWSVRDGRFVDELEMLPLLKGYVLLGEKHDNPDHHALQAEVLRALVIAGSKPVVAFEMFDVDTQAAIDASRRTSPRDAASLARAVNWEKSGWPAWSFYVPIVQVALDADLPIVAAGLSATTMRAMMKATGSGAGADAGATTPIDEGVPLTAEQQASLLEELRESHCGHLPETMLSPMMRMQRARDVSMAKALVVSVEQAGSGGVLIAGTGHTRTDRGVPIDLRARDPHRPVWSIAFAEVEGGKLEPSAYAARWNTARLPFDFVWFTPRANDDDPCAAFAH
jgi:uncharacterized iron-regulated protein